MFPRGLISRALLPAKSGRSVACMGESSLRGSVALCIAVALSITLLVGCGSGQPASTDDSSRFRAEPDLAMSPEQVGEAITEVYLRAMDAVATMLRDRPPAAEVSAQLFDMREQWIAEMVSLGRHVEGFDEVDRATVRRSVRAMYARLQSDPDLSRRWSDFSRAINAYSVTDPKFAQVLRPLNILTQYAFFDLLREQSPTEAARLGLSAPVTPETPGTATAITTGESP